MCLTDRDGESPAAEAEAFKRAGKTTKTGEKTTSLSSATTTTTTTATTTRLNDDDDDDDDVDEPMAASVVAMLVMVRELVVGQFASDALGADFESTQRAPRATGQAGI